MGLLDTLSIGRRALGAASAGIDVTSQNIANANTVGYSRRRVVQQTTEPVLRRGQYLGSGVEVSGIRRASDRLLGVRIVAMAGQEASATARESTLTAAQGIWTAGGSDGPESLLSAFYDTLSSLTADPSDISARQATVVAGESLASGIHELATGWAQAIDDANAAVEDQLSTINGDLTQIAALNKQIGRSGATLGPGDLLDRRDQLVREVGELSGATVELAADGQATVFIGGQAAVSGGEARLLSMSTDSAGVAQVSIATGSGSLRVSGDLGGTTGGTLDARDAIQGWLDDLDSFASTLATTFNTQHALGYDQNGAPGGALFSINAADPAATLSLDAAVADDPSLLAAAGSATASPGDKDNLEAMLNLENTTSFGGKTGADALSALAAGVGTETAAATADAASLGDQLGDLDAMRDAVSRVDTDEEAIQLIAFQTAYRAAARVLTTSDEMMQTLLAIGG